MMKKNAWAPLIIAALVLLGGCARADYKAAVEVYETGDYAAAAEAFRRLEDYKDSAVLARDCEAQLSARRDAALRESMTGRWVCEALDVTEDFMAALPENGENGSLYGLCRLPVIEMDLELSLGAEGSYVLVFSEEDSLAAEKAVTAALKEGVREYLLTVLREVYAEAGVTMEEAYVRSGAADDEEFLEVTMAMSTEEIYESMGIEDMVTDRWQRNVREGNWAVENGTLTLDGAVAAYSAAEDTITLDGRVYMRK